MLRLRGITLNRSDPQGLSEFWKEALGYERRALWPPFVGLKDPAGRDPLVTFQRDPSPGANHLHLDLYADDPDGEADRLENLGAEEIRRVEEGDTWWWILHDPHGNEFCVIAATGEDRAV
jgi:hypothetical protein